MMLCGVLIGLLVMGGAIALSTTRSARLKRMARTLHLRYDKKVDNPLTALAAQSVSLFNHSLHQFRQVLTWREPGMFIRLCQMDSRSLAGGISNVRYTLATAELTRGNFTAFVLQPHTQEKTPVHPALPPELATRFTLTAPDNFQLPPQVIGLLKAGPLCYLEVSSYALVYHTYTILSINQLQPMRLRTQQLARALMHADPTPVSPVSANMSAMAELRAETMLQMHSPSAAGCSYGGVLKFIYRLIGLVFVVGVLWAVQHFLRSFVH